MYPWINDHLYHLAVRYPSNVCVFMAFDIEEDDETLGNNVLEILPFPLWIKTICNKQYERKKKQRTKRGRERFEEVSFSFSSEGFFLLLYVYMHICRLT